MIPTRDPALLHPLLSPLWMRFMRRCREAKLLPVFTFGFRSRHEQDCLYQIGRRGVEGEKTVTNARGGQSWHNVDREGKPAALAFDVALLDSAGRALLPDTDPAWTTAGEIGEGLGLTWLGRGGRGDKCHYQLDDHGALTLAAAMGGTDPTTEEDTA